MKSKFTMAVAATVFAAASVLGGGQALAGYDAGDGDVTPQIIGGDKPSEKYEFHASLQYKDQGDRPSPHRCGGSLIEPQWIITSAHCVASIENNGQLLDPDDFQIVIGANDYRKGKVMEIAEFYRHPAWYVDNYGADLGLIKLARPSYEEPVQRALHGNLDEPVRILGWGLTDADDPESAPTLMRELDTQLVPHIDCHYGNDYDAIPCEVCVGAPDSGTSVCAGDDGSPVLRDIDGEWFLFGVASRSIDGYFEGCGNAPDIYTTTASFEDWIADTIHDDHN